MNQPNPPPADAGTLGAFYAFVVRSMDTGFCILEPVRDGAGQTVDFRVVDANPAFEVHSGLNHALGRSLLEMLPDSAGRWIEFLDSAKPGGVPVCLREGSGPFGRRFDVQAIRTGGAAGQVAVLFRNVTQRTLRDLALRRSESRYRRLFESIDEGFCIIEMEFDAQGHPVDYRFLEINPSFERQTGMRGAQGKSMLALAPAHERHWFETYGQVARSGQPIRFQNLASALGRWFDVYAFPAGEPNQVAILFTDISARMRAEQRLKDSDQRKDEFLAMLAHELRNPLAPIGAAAELLERGQLDATLVSQASAIIRRQVRHLTGLVDDLLDVSRVTRGLVTLDCRRVDTKRVLSEAVEQVRPLMEARRHTLTLHTPPDAAWVLGDHERLVQVMTNLLNNAAKYTPLGGQVGLHLEVAKGQVCVTVSDNGIGMEPAFLEAAFELFAQAERSADRSQGGLGIGLALVKRLVELHGGTVALHSEGRGRGSTFSVRLPQLPPDFRSPAAEPPPATGAVAQRSLRVMVVDDNADAAQTLAMLIRSMGHQASVVLDSHQALLQGESERPEVFVLDIGLPDMNGHELARRLRAQPATASAVLIAITGYGQEQDRDEALQAGFDHHFVKPVDRGLLEALLAQVAKA